MKIKKSLSKGLLLALAFSLIPVMAFSAQKVTAGSTCKTLNQKVMIQKKIYTCIKTGKKLVWNQGAAVALPTPTAKPTPKPIVTPMPTPTAVGDPVGAIGGTPTSTPTATLKKIQADGCHAQVSAVVQVQQNSVWKDLKVADGWAPISTCPSTNPYQPYVNVDLEYGVVVRWHIYAPGAWDFYSDPTKLRAPFVPATACQLPSQDGNSGLSQGFPKRISRIKSVGTVNAVVIPVDFPDVIGVNSPLTDYNTMLEGLNTFYKKMSGGRLNFNFTILPEYVRLPFNSNKFGLGTWSSGDGDGYIQAILKAADPKVDYSKYDVFYLLSPRSIPWSSIAYGPAALRTFATDEGNIVNVTFSGADAYQDFPGADWKWVAHETGHLFGLHDLYVSPGNATYGAWDIMSLNWSVAAIELNAWNRYIQGWLEDSQIKCLEKSKSTTLEITLDPIERSNSLVKAVVVKLSDSKILVIESRRSEGLDVLSTAQAGTLVYTVDMTIPSIKGGWQTQRRPGSTDSNFIDAALKTGDKIVVDGVTIEIISQNAQGDVVKIIY